MKNTFLTTYWFIIGLLIISSCSSSKEEKHDVHPESVRLNDIAVEFISQAGFSDRLKEMELLNKALVYLDSAEKIDVKNSIAFSNKISVLNQLSRFEESISTHHNYFKHTSPIAETYASLGFVLEKNHKIDSAQKYYNKGIDSYKKRLTDKDYNPVHVKADMAFLYLFMEDNSESKNIITELKKTDGLDEQTISFIEMLENFDKHDFLRNY